MFYPLPLYVGLRYVRTRSRGFFVSFISWVSMLGVCLGVAALIIVLSVMNGLEAEIRGRMLSLASHATLSADAAHMQSWQSLAERARQVEGVAGVAPFVQTQAMIGRGLQLSAVQIRGVLPGEEPQVSEFGRYLKVGRLDDLTPGSQNVILGAGLAYALQARVGDELTVLVPQVHAEGDAADSDLFEIRPRMQTFTVSGVFEVAVQEHDNVLALVNMEDAAALIGVPGVPSGLRLKFTDIFAAPTAAPRIAEALAGPGVFTVSDWAKENASYFRAVRIEKTMMTLILTLIVAVAAFNIVAALVMVVNEKRTDIAILRTLGVPRRGIVGVFITQGVLIGWIGTLLGVALGLSVALNVETIVPFLERLLGFQMFDADIFYISAVPSEVHAGQVLTIGLVALVLTTCSTIYPALRGAATEPAEALRYE